MLAKSCPLVEPVDLNDSVQGAFLESLARSDNEVVLIWTLTGYLGERRAGQGKDIGYT
jgi:hypothetical protein